MRFSPFLAFVGALISVTTSAPIAQPPDIVLAAPRDALAKPGFTPVDALSPLKKRAPTITFTNCTPEQQAKIRDALRGVIDLCQGLLSNAANPIDPNTLLYRRIFGDPQIARLVAPPAGPVNPDDVHATVLQNFQNLANFDNLNSVTINFNCDEQGTNRKAGTSNEAANVAHGTQMNLFPGFLNAPTWAQMIVQTTWNTRPTTVTPIDWLRNDRGILLHELLHITGVGVNQQRNGVVLDRQLRSGETAYGEVNVQQLAFENPALAANNADSYRVFFDAVVFYHQNYFTEAQQLRYQADLSYALWDIQNQNQPAGGGQIDPDDLPPAYDADPVQNTSAPQGTGWLWGNLHIAGGSGAAHQNGDF